MNLDNIDFYLRDYYLHAYPADLIVKWLSYGKKDAGDYLTNREFAFILKDDFHMRFLSFANAAEFKERLHRCVPHKIDIGAVYNRPPRDRKKIGDFTPLERELVFDIDLTDYDSIRNCCKETSVCQKCWRWIIIASVVLEHLLRTHFGFNNLLWVFSGRRGIHCWVADRKARALSSRARDAIAKYLTFDKEGSAISKRRVHPFVEHSYRQTMESGQFDRMVVEQGWLETPEKWAQILKLCADPKLAETIDREFAKIKTPEMRWELLKLRFDEVARRKAKEAQQSFPSAPSEAAKNFLRVFVMEYAYPRLDAKVTAGLNHLLKAPFTVHPKNGNIAVPLDANAIAHFELDNVPRIDKLSAEVKQSLNVNSSAKENEETGGGGGSAFHQTSLAPYIGVFHKWIDGISRSEQQQ